jgi:hypothetical protein
MIQHRTETHNQYESSLRTPKGTVRPRVSSAPPRVEHQADATTITFADAEGSVFVAASPSRESSTPKSVADARAAALQRGDIAPRVTPPAQTQAPTLRDTLANWNDFAYLRREGWTTDRAVEVALKAAKAKVQPVDLGFGSEIADTHSIIIERMPEGLTPQAYLGEMARDLNAAVNDASFNIVNLFARRSAAREPRVGDIYDIDIALPDNGSVMLVESAPSHFIFQTIETPETGTHPEHGIRAFGYELLEGGAVRFLTRGVSRISPLYWPGSWFAKSMQSMGWTSMMTGIGESLTLRGGKVRPNSNESTSASRD